MKSLKIILSIISTWMLLSGTDAVFAQFVQNNSRSLFSDVKAFQPGDALMVLIVEDTQADNSASTNDSRSTAMNGSVGASFNGTKNEADANLGTGTDFKGSAATKRAEKIRSKLSVKITEVDAATGNLSVEGKRTTKINGETQTIVIKGIVRPVDIQQNNTIYSYNILDLTLFIEGDGSVSKVQEPGLITKFFRFLF